MPNPFDLTGKRYFVTGASSGIGRGICQLLDHLGAVIFMTGRDVSRLDETLKSLSGSGHRMEVRDLTSTADIPAWMKSISGVFGPFNGLIHSAGVHQLKPVQFLSDDAWAEVLTLNAMAAFQLTKGYRQRGVNSPPGSVVLIGSVMGTVGQPGAVAYSASKGAVSAMTRSLALELAPQKIRVNCVAPGQIRTEMTDRQRQTLTPEQFQAIENMHPLGLGEVIDVAHAVAFFLADTGRWATGTTLVLDGGYTAH